MGPETDEKPPALQRLLAGAPTMRGPAPVHLWNPPYCGDIDMAIAADGTWRYNGSPIGRIAMVKLFASILRRDAERFVLVTPVERVGIAVEDAPFVAVELATEPGEQAERLFIRTNLDDVVEIGAEHAVRFETAPDGGLKPYIHVRGGLWALASRSLAHELVGRAAVETVTGEDGRPTAVLGLRSGATFFPIAPADALGGDQATAPA